MRSRDVDTSPLSCMKKPSACFGRAEASASHAHQLSHPTFQHIGGGAGAFRPELAAGSSNCPGSTTGTSAGCRSARTAGIAGYPNLGIHRSR